jgi:uncharacterized oxidoreductase
LAKNNRVIITGRSEERLKTAAAKLPGIHYIACDINKPEDVTRLEKYLIDNFNGLDILINNAGHAYAYQLGFDANAAKKAAEEMQTNYIAVIGLTETLLPLLHKSVEGAIVNVSSVVAFVANGVVPTYSASKAALHSYTQSLRYSLSKTSNIKVFELMPPLVDTDFSSAIGGSNGLLDAFEQDIYEIHTGNTAYIYNLTRTAPDEAFKILNQDRGN